MQRIAFRLKMVLVVVQAITVRLVLPRMFLVRCWNQFLDTVLLIMLTWLIT